jgi:hypothetical protein
VHDLPDPVVELLVEVIEVGESAGSKERFADVADPSPRAMATGLGAK